METGLYIKESMDDISQGWVLAASTFDCHIQRLKPRQTDNTVQTLLSRVFCKGFPTFHATSLRHLSTKKLSKTLQLPKMHLLFKEPYRHTIETPPKLHQCITIHNNRGHTVPRKTCNGGRLLGTREDSNVTKPHRQESVILDDKRQKDSFYKCLAKVVN